MFVVFFRFVRQTDKTKQRQMDFKQFRLLYKLISKNKKLSEKRHPMFDRLHGLLPHLLWCGAW